MKHDGITEAALRDLVEHFCSRSRADPPIGRVFNDATDDNWGLIPVSEGELVPASVVVRCASRPATRDDL